MSVESNQTSDPMFLEKVNASKWILPQNKKDYP